MHLLALCPFPSPSGAKSGLVHEGTQHSKFPHISATPALREFRTHQWSQDFNLRSIKSPQFRAMLARRNICWVLFFHHRAVQQRDRLFPRWREGGFFKQRSSGFHVDSDMALTHLIDKAKQMMRMFSDVLPGSVRIRIGASFRLICVTWKHPTR